MADDRIIAVCEGGPLDGLFFSVQLNEKGKPEPLYSREKINGVLYIPDLDSEFTPEEEHKSSFLQGEVGIEHTRAYKYVVGE